MLYLGIYLFSGQIETAISNINKCSKAITVEVEMANFLQKTYFSSSNPLFNTEDRLLALASSQISDEIFFCCVLKIQMEKPIYIARHFEYGTFENFYKDNVHSQLKSMFDLVELLPYKVYTNDDVKAKRERDISLYQKRKNKKGQCFLYYISKIFIFLKVIVV